MTLGPGVHFGETFEGEKLESVEAVLNNQLGWNVIRD